MNRIFVLDCSVTMSWFFTDEQNPELLKLQDLLINGIALVPQIWCLEVANVLWGAERAGRTTPYQSGYFASLLAGLPIDIDEKSSSLASGSVLELAREYLIPVYDASYLELSLRFGLPLATLDKVLRKAAQKAGVPLLPKLL